MKDLQEIEKSTEEKLKSTETKLNKNIKDMY